MKKMWGICILVLSCFCYAGNTWGALPGKDKKIEYAEEEKQKEHKKKVVKSSIDCGITSDLRVAGFVTNPPFGWVNVIPETRVEKEKLLNDGFGYDLFYKMAKNLNLHVKNVGYSSYQEAMRDLRRGRLDVIVGAYYDKNILGIGTNLLSPSFFTNPIIPLFVKGKERPVNSFEDLKGLKGVVRQEELIYPIIYRQLPEDVELKQVAGARKAFTALMTGEADYLLTSLYSGEAEVRRFKLVDDIYFSNRALIVPELFIVFSSHTSCWRLKPRFAEELEKLKADKKAYFKYFVEYVNQWGERFKDEPSLKEDIAAQKAVGAGDKIQKPIGVPLQEENSL